MFSFSKKSIFFAILTSFALSVAVAADTMATPPAISAAEAARRASDRIDRDLQNSTDQFNREFQQAENQIHEAQRLGQPSSARNTYGVQSDIEREIDQTVDKANLELRRAAHRDNYLESRRELERNRSLYYPNSDGYNKYTDQIEALDREFAAQEANRL